MNERNRLAWSTIFVLTVVVISIGGIAWFIAKDTVNLTLRSMQVENNKQQSIRFANTLQHQIEKGINRDEVLKNFQTILFNLPKEESGFVCLLGPDTRVAAHPDPKMLGMSMKQATRIGEEGISITFEEANLQKTAGGGLWHASDGHIEIVYQVPVIGAEWLMSVHVNDKAITNRVDKIMHTLFWIALPSAILVILMGSIAVRKTARHYENKLEEANQTLEEKVKTRTKQLEDNLVDLKLAKEKLKQSEKMSFLGELVAGIAHEINNPLAVISLSTEVIELKTDLSPVHKKNIQRISTAADRCIRLVKNLLSFSRKQPLHTAETTIKTLLHTVIELLETEINQSKTQFCMDIPEDLPSVMVDRLQMEQVFFNLVKNGIQAMGTQPEKRINIKGKIQSKWILIEVEDNGPGIPENQLDKLFDAFFTSKKQGKGTGLGLSLCNQFIMAHGGEIKVTSEVGTGTCFQVFLPLHS